MVSMKREDRVKLGLDGFGWFYAAGLLTGILICVLVLFILVLTGVMPRWWSSDVADEVWMRASAVDHYIDKYYWKPEDVSDEKMADYAAKGMVSALGDKYSFYFTDEEYEDSMRDIEGEFVGIGAVLMRDSKTGKKYIQSVTEGQPAARAGLKAEDEILKVDGQDVSELTLTETTALVKGEEGTSVVFTVARKENGKTVTKEITVVLGEIVNQSVSYKMLEGKIGYIDIKNFDKETVKQFEDGIAALDKQGQKGMIVDVRNNGGGALTAVIGMLNRLLPAGNLITEKSRAEEDMRFKSTDEKHFDKPMAVLINGGSASASEVFAGTLQDREAAVLVGEQSFGKGIVQAVYSLADSCGGGIKLTTGEYFLPSGRSIHGKGLTPDVKVEYTGTSKELGAGDDNQLAKALEVMEKEISE